MRRAVIACLSLGLSACVLNLGDVSGGDKQTQTRSVDPFEAIAIEGSVDVDAKVGSALSVEVEADGKIIDKVETRVHNGTLHVSLERGVHVNTGRMLVRVTVPSLTSVAVSGSGDAMVEGIEAESFAIAVSGSGDVEAGGEAKSVTVTVSGSGDVGARALEAEDANVVIRGSGDITVTATETAKGAIQGSGDVTVHGGADCSIAVAGSGDVNC